MFFIVEWILLFLKSFVILPIMQNDYYAIFSNIWNNQNHIKFYNFLLIRWNKINSQFMLKVLLCYQTFEFSKHLQSKSTKCFRNGYFSAAQFIKKEKWNIIVVLKIPFVRFWKIIIILRLKIKKILTFFLKLGAVNFLLSLNVLKTALTSSVYIVKKI